MRLWLGLVIAVSVMGCGRVGFDSLTPGGDATGDGAVNGDSGTDGAAVSCAGGDGVCRVSCLATDPDCTTTCGDGVCVGNAGELCTNCADCNTRSPVCGNGQCDPGEDSDVCYADCGPSPWTWTSQEMEFMTLFNNARTAGITCPSSSTVTAPTLATAGALTQASREWAWEVSYAGLGIGNACNGRTGDDRAVAAGATPIFSDWVILGPTSPSAALNGFIANSTICTQLVNNAYMRAGVGVAIFNGRIAYVLMLD